MAGSAMTRNTNYRDAECCHESPACNAEAECERDWNGDQDNSERMAEPQPT
jgi:hypothetical protein